MKRFISICITVAIVLCCTVPVVIFAHSGRTDAYGGHWDYSTGTYHYHNGGSSSISVSDDSYHEKQELKNTIESLETENDELKDKIAILEKYEKQSKELENELHTKSKNIAWLIVLIVLLIICNVIVLGFLKQYKYEVYSLNYKLNHKAGN